MPRIPSSLVFNELSIRDTYAPDRATMLTWMQGLVDVLKTAFDRGIQSFRTDSDFRNLPLMIDGYTIQRWCEDDGLDIDRDVQGFLLSYFTQDAYIKPYIADLPDSHTIKRRISRGFITGYEGAEAIGLGYAYLLQQVGVSFQSKDCWISTFIDLEHMEDTEEGELDDVVQVKHVATVLHLNHHSPRRTYDGNPKHPDIGEGEGYISIMDLSRIKAQQALLEGVQPEGMDEVYSYYDQAFYVFRPHRAENGQYHGYRVTQFNPVNKTRILKAMRDMDIIEQRDYDRFIN